MIGTPEAFIGALVLVCNIILFWYINQQFRQGREAIGLAGQANRASIESDRGRLAHVRSDMFQGSIGLHYEFRNVGASPLTVRSVEITPLQNPHPITEAYLALMPGESFHNGHLGVASSIHGLPHHVRRRDSHGNTVPITVRFRIRYETMGSMYELRAAVKLETGYYPKGTIDPSGTSEGPAT